MVTRVKTASRGALIAVLALLSGCAQEFDPWHQDRQTGRWYTTAQVAQGKVIYRENCAHCHGQQAESTPPWNRPDAQGLYPPPPLNGTAHAWHHPYPILRQIILQGSRGRMPAWEGKLTDAEVAAVIAWFQSLWPEEGYRIWRDRHRH